MNTIDPREISKPLRKDVRSGRFMKPTWRRGVPVVRSYLDTLPLEVLSIVLEYRYGIRRTIPLRKVLEWVSLLGMDSGEYVETRVTTS
jgi:hypothetical protein